MRKRANPRHSRRRRDMKTWALTLDLTPVRWGCAVHCAALIAFACSPGAETYPLAALGILAFIATPIFLPACRPNLQMVLCPANVAQGFFWIQLVWLPLLIGYGGLARGTLPHLPSTASVNVGIGLR